MLHNPHQEKQNQKRIPDRFERPVDIHHHIPDRPALKRFRRLRQEPPDLIQLVVSGAEGVLDVFYDPVVRHPAASASSAGTQGQNFFCKGDDDAARKRQKAVCPLAWVMAFE